LDVAHPVGRQHSANRALDQPFGVLSLHVEGGFRAQAAREAAVAAVDLLKPLVAAELDLLGVEDHDVVAVVDVGRPGRFVLPGKGLRDANG